MAHRVVLPLQSLPTGIRLLAADEPWPNTPSTSASPAQPSSNASTSREPVSHSDTVEDVARLAQGIRDALVQFEERLQKQREAWRQSAIELGSLIAAQFFRQSVDRGTFPWSEMIDEMTATLEGASIQVRLHPADWECWQHGQPGEPSPSRIRVSADPQLRRGECLVESDVEVRLLSLADYLRSARERLLREWERDPI